MELAELARKTGRWAWRHKWDIAATAATSTPGLGEAVWACCGYRAHKALTYTSRFGAWTSRSGWAGTGSVSSATSTAPDAWVG